MTKGDFLFKINSSQRSTATLFDITFQCVINEFLCIGLERFYDGAI